MNSSHRNQGIGGGKHGDVLELLPYDKIEEEALC